MSVEEKAKTAIKMIDRQLTELDEIVNHALSKGNIDMGHARLRRWKARTTRLIAGRVNTKESEEFDNIRLTMYGGYKDENFACLAQKYKNALVSLKEEFEKHPEGILSTPVVVDKPHDSVKNTKTTSPPTVFIVHGHDEAAKETVARFIEKVKLKAIILHEQPNAGRTIIEKFEDYANVGFAVVLITPDDIGAAVDEKDNLKPRARQNVIFELGFFFGKLGRKRVCALYKEGVDLPSDYKGVLYVLMDESGAWKLSLAREIKAAGLSIDLNKVL